MPAVDAPRERIASIDVVRGFVMALMLLDHTRDFVHSGTAAGGDPLDLASTTYPLYFTRWITHFCAPVFVFLAGTSARLRELRGASKREMSRFLLSRGLWLIALELVVIRPLIFFNLDFRLLAFLQVIWAIGWSMVALAALVHLPLRAVAAIGLALVAGHNLLDGFSVPDWRGPGGPAPSALESLWLVLHQRGAFPLGETGPFVIVAYPLLPWIGTLALGYVFGELYTLEPERRRYALLALGAGVVALFVVLRASNLYGDPRPWERQERPGWTLLSFLNTEKYPPSLLYLSMTLGPAALALAWLDGRPVNALGRRLSVLGSVPLFFYVLQWPTVHLLSKLFQYLSDQPRGWDSMLWFEIPQEWAGRIGHSLPAVYLAWALGLAGLYPLCAWFAALKRRRRDLGWLSYL